VPDRIELVALGAVLVLAIGCQGAAPEADAPAADTPAANEVAVRLVGLRFEPTEVVVPVGQSVVWRWTDRVAHNVVADGAAFKASRVQSGGSYRITFDKAGTYPYQCTLHEGMRGTVVAR